MGIKVVLGISSPLLSGLMKRTIGKYPEIEIIAETRRLADLASLLTQAESDWLITSLKEDNRLHPEVTALLTDHPRLSFLGINHCGDRIRIQPSGGEQELVRDISLSDIMHCLGVSYG